MFGSIPMKSSKRMENAIWKLAYLPSFSSSHFKDVSTKSKSKVSDNSPQTAPHRSSSTNMATIVSNHPLGGEDGVALGKLICHKYDSKMKYLVNDLLMNLKGLAPLCIPINKTGSQSRDFPRMVEAAFQSDNNVLMFPAGLCSRKQDDGTIRDLPWKKTFVTKSIEYKRDVIPVHFSGHNSDKFYNIARFCKKHKLKFNFAMLYLVDEMYKNVGKHFTVTFGEPIPWQTFTDKSKTHAQWAQWVQDKVYEL